jgi:hypothetical protein
MGGLLGFGLWAFGFWWHALCRRRDVRILIYQNPDAGHEHGLPAALIETLQRAGHEIAWKNSKEHRLSDPSIEGFDLVVAAGGDGSVGRTARQLVGGMVPIAVLPLGTANNLASILDGKRLSNRITSGPSSVRRRHGRLVANGTGSSRASASAPSPRPQRK